MKKYYTLIATLTLLIVSGVSVWAGPTLTLRSIPNISELEIGSTIHRLTLIARVDTEGLDFRWELDGPGSLEGDPRSRKVSYRPPERLDEASAKVSILATVTDSQGAAATQTLEFTLTASAEPSVTPQPHSLQKHPEPAGKKNDYPALPSDFVQRPGKLWLVLIGIGEYTDKGIPAFSGAEQDVQELSRLFRDPRYGGLPPEQIQLLQGAEATDRAVKYAIGSWLKAQAAAEDAVLIYYAGSCLFEGQDWYWVTQDAELEDLYATALNQDDLKEIFARIPARRVVTILNGNTHHIHQNDPPETREANVPWKIFSGPERMLVSAFTSASEMDGPQKNSRSDFISPLIVGLQGKADTDRDGLITAAELWRELEPQASENFTVKEDLHTVRLHGAPFEDFPLNFDTELLRQKYEDALWQTKQDRFVEIYRSGAIPSEQFTKGFQMIKNRQHDQILEDLLDAKISIELFIETF